MAAGAHLYFHLAENVPSLDGFLAFRLSRHLSVNHLVYKHVHDDVYGSFQATAQHQRQLLGGQARRILAVGCLSFAAFY